MCAGHACLCVRVCRVEDLVVQAVLTCPPVPQLRTRDLSLLEELPGSAKGALGLTLWEPTAGTIACRLGDLAEPLVRKYFYLNSAPRIRCPGGREQRSGTPEPGDHGVGWCMGV